MYKEKSKNVKQGCLNVKLYEVTKDIAFVLMYVKSNT